MPLPSSQTSASSSPSLKRKQPTISSFFTKTPLGSQQSPPNEANRSPSVPINNPEEPENAERPVEEEDDEDIVAPAPKRAKSNGSQQENHKQSPKAKPVSHAEQAPQPASSQRTELSKFTSSPAVDTAAEKAGELDNGETKARQKEREKLHQKFVRRLGGPDCLVGIGRNSVSETTPMEEAGEGEEDEEAAQPPRKGKAAGKKGGGKLTPMEKQIIEIKKKHMDTILLVEVGYKFRFFGEDARVAAKELSIVCIPGKFRYDERKSASPSTMMAQLGILMSFRSVRSPPRPFCLRKYTHAATTCSCKAPRHRRT